MAIDSAAKRFSILDFDLPTAPGLPPPDGTIAAGDRFTFLWLYAGITPGDIDPNPVPRQTLVNRGGRRSLLINRRGRNSVLIRRR